MKLYEAGYWDARHAVIKIIDARIKIQNLTILEELRNKILELKPEIDAIPAYAFPQPVRETEECS